MQTVDLSKLLDTPAFEKSYPGGGSISGVYGHGEGAQIRSEGHNSGELLQEIVRISDGAFLLACDFSPSAEGLHRQVVSDTDWLHLQFRIRGGGQEELTDQKDAATATPEGSWAVATYPKDSVIERRLEHSDRRRFVCLLANPAGLAKILDVTPSKLIEWRLWLADEDRANFKIDVLPLQSAMMLTSHDILSCSFKGAARRTYMRAKSLELLAMAIHALNDAPPQERSSQKLSSLDLQRIARAKAIMTDELDHTLTLAELARRVGLNRTKLAVGFKQVYGESVQAYWRDAKLCRARELLLEHGARVTDVALGLGYSEISSFTRAFSRKFGVLPRTCKANI